MKNHIAASSERKEHELGRKLNMQFKTLSVFANSVGRRPHVYIHAV